MPQELFECYTESCEVYPADDDDVPEKLRTRSPLCDSKPIF